MSLLCQGKTLDYRVLAEGQAPIPVDQKSLVGNPNEEEPFRGVSMRIRPPREETQAAEIAVEIVSSKVGGKRYGIATQEPALAEMRTFALLERLGRP